MKRFFYAIVDSFVGFNAGEHSRGFANTKKAVAFRCKQDREDFLRETRDLSAKIISREEAFRRADDVGHHHKGTYVLVRENRAGDVGVQILGRYWATGGHGEPKIKWMLANNARINDFVEVEG